MLLCSSVYADAKLYLGLGYANINEKFDNLDVKRKSLDAGRIKIGYGIRENYAIELSIEGIKNEAKILSDRDEDRYGANIELVKSLDLDTFIYPYFKAGFGAGSMKTTRDDTEQSLSYGNFNFGLGTYIAINEHFDFELGYEYKQISYERIDLDATTKIGYKSKANVFYFGLNTRF